MGLDLSFFLYLSSGFPKIDTGRRVISKMDRASTSWTVEADQGQIAKRYGGERSGKLTIWLRSGLTGDRDVQGVDGESTDGEEDENDFGEHDDGERREE